MELLAWPVVKAQLYLLEASYVKNAVGRERIRRNKDALRELRCLQEILVDLHAGHFGRESARRVAGEAAIARWAELHEAAVEAGRAPEELCKVSPGVRRFLLTRPAANSGLPLSRCNSEAASSTRAPSTAAAATASPEPDSQSTVADSRSEAAAAPAPAEPGCVRAGGSPGARLCRQQLDALAAELREQLDQEYTSLLASIEEVQCLMEAEVAGVSSLPSRAELEAFSAAAAAVLAEHGTAAVQATSDAGGGPPAPPEHGAAEVAAAVAAVHEQGCVDPLVNENRNCNPEDADVLVFPARATRAVGEADPEESGITAADMVAMAAPARPAKPAPRRRWADSFSDSEEAPLMPGAPAPLGSDPDRCAAGDIGAMAATTVGGCTSAPLAAARAKCSSCGTLLSRTGFSRRAWREARGLGRGGQGRREPGRAACLACSRATSAKVASHSTPAIGRSPLPRER